MQRMATASRAAARYEVATAAHDAAALWSDAVKDSPSAFAWTAATIEESVARRAESAARRALHGGVAAARAAAARVEAAEARERAQLAYADRLAQKRLAIRDRQDLAAADARVRTAQQDRWAAGQHAQESAAAAWRRELGQRAALQQQRQLAAAQAKAHAAARAAAALQERAQRAEATLLQRHDANRDGVLDAGEFHRLEAEVMGDGRFDEEDFLRLLR